MNKIEENFLDKKPSQKLKSQIDKYGNISLIIEHNGLFDKIAQKILKKPKISYVHMEEIGSHIWSLIDGKRSIEQIAQSIKEKFGEDVEPLYPRLVEYFKQLERYGFIE